ncbi:LysR family transcriptional regulator [Herbaspirillum lusitanum]|uniref:LysR family transcriptional regulator n=1 Tax=Herbaspirillum lusitanum TaxID=213312 RepID=A0ABW9ABI1_9BURK
MRRKTLNERDLRALRIFRAAAQAKGFAAAEKQLNMTKATISRQIKAVEDSLGCILCVRGPQGFELTQDGQTALRYAQEALDALDRIVPAVDAARGMISGAVVLGMSDNVIGNPAGSIQRALDELGTMAPEVALTLQTMPSNSLINALLERELDLVIKGIHHVHPRIASLRYLELFEETHKLYYVKSKDADGVARKPASLPIVFRAAQPFVEDAIAHGYRRGPEAIGMESVAMLIASTHYVGILPTHYANMLKPILPLQEVPKSPFYSVPIYAITNTSRPLSIAAEKALELLLRSHGKRYK